MAIFLLGEMFKLQRVECLYRVSTKGQVDKNDIPMQKESCRNFVSQHKNWQIIKEYYEKGVSGFKKKAADRDALQRLKKDATNKQFDILLVFMFDRLGRRDDETPFVVEWFVKQGVEVWSTQEGQQKFEQHVDKLINYIRFWQSSGESEKTSIRVDTKLRQMAEQGLYNGGTPPYGYDLVKSGKFNKKGKELLKLQINIQQASIVKQIYNYVYNYGFGKHRIAKALNSQHIMTINESTWNDATIRTILRNPIYKGFPAYGKTTKKTGTSTNTSKKSWTYSNKKQNDLIIIDETIWSKVQQIITANTNSRNSIVENKITCSPLLYVGIIYCGYCGSPLTTTYNYKYNKNKTKKYVYPKYRCTGKATKNNNCKGQTVYSATWIENNVAQQLYVYFNELYNKPYKNNNDTNYIESLNKQQQLLNKKINKIKKEYAALTKEISLSLIGESKFQSDLLASLINDKEKELSNLCLQQTNLQQEINNYHTPKDCQILIKDIINNWDTYILSLDYKIKKMLFRTIIKRIDVFKNRIDITLRDDISNFLLTCKKIKEAN